MPDHVKVAIPLRVIGVRGNDIYENAQYSECENKDNYAESLQFLQTQSKQNHMSSYVN